jgi:protocatechuate 3,4-dioxygenase beta subunit
MRWFLILTILCAPAWACSCGYHPSAKEAWLDSPLVFVGIVDKTDLKITGEGQHTSGEQVAQVRVTEVFKGVMKDQVLELRDRFSSCFSGFHEGTELLFYLHPGEKPGTWIAPACHRSRSIEHAVDDFRFLRALPASALGNRVSGLVYLWEPGVDGGVDRDHSMAGVRVRAVNASDTHETVTDAQGFYEFRNLPPGTYRVHIDNPKGTTLRFPIGYGKTGLQRFPRSKLASETQLEVTAESGNGFDFVLASDTRISGRVLDPDGRPMKDVCIDIESLQASSAGSLRVFDCTESDGSYTLEKMPPGSYRIVANRNGSMSAAAPFGKLYHPGTPDGNKGTILTITAGQHIANVDFRVSALARRIELRGRLIFSDGIPVPRQSLHFSGDDGRYQQHGSSDADGNFVMQILAGRPGSLTSEIMVWRHEQGSCSHFPVKLNPNGTPGPLKSASYRVAGETGVSGVEVVFPFRSCEAWLKSEAERKF